MKARVRILFLEKRKHGSMAPRGKLGGQDGQQCPQSQITNRDMNDQDNLPGHRHRGDIPITQRGEGDHAVIQVGNKSVMNSTLATDSFQVALHPGGRPLVHDPVDQSKKNRSGRKKQPPPCHATTTVRSPFPHIIDVFSYHN